MKRDIIAAVLAVLFAVGGIWGLYNHVEHTGWLLAVAVILVLFRDWGGK